MIAEVLLGVAAPVEKRLRDRQRIEQVLRSQSPSEMCQRCQYSVSVREKYGRRKFSPMVMPNICATPREMSMPPEKSA